MRIGIDARFYGFKNRGIGRYVKNLVDRIVEINNDDSLIIFLSTENFSLFHTLNPKVEKVLLDIKWYGIKEQLLLPQIIRKKNLDLMHFTHFNAPYFYSGKYIITMHDLTMEKYPDAKNTTLPIWLYKIKHLAYKLLLRKVVKKAVKIITPSAFVKNDLINLFKTEPGKINIIYEGAEKLNCQNTAINAEIQKFKPYFFYIGAAYPHKNLELLMQAFSEFNKKKQYRLVLAGRLDFFYKRLMSVNQDKNINFLGEVDDVKLATLYQNAELLVYPSLSEGFGLPILEAQNLGKPALCAMSSCLPEIYGNSVCYFNPFDKHDLINKLIEFAGNEDLMNKYSILGLENSKRYSLELMAEKTNLLYNIAMKN